jgi:hypothetical protein
MPRHTIDMIKKYHYLFNKHMCDITTWNQLKEFAILKNIVKKNKK